MYCDASSANLDQQCARNAVQNPSIVAAVNVGDFYGQYAGIATSGNMPIIGDQFYTTADDACKTCFGFQPGALLVGGAAAVLADVLKVKNVVVGYIDVPAGQALPSMINAGVLAPRNLKLAGSVPIPATLTDASTIVASLPSGTGGFVPGTPQNVAAQLIIAIRKSGATYPIAVSATTLAASQIASLVGSQATNIYVVSPFKQSGPGYTAYQNDMSAIGKKGSLEDNSIALNGWLSIQLLKAAAQKGGAENVSRQSLIQTVSTMTNWSTGGLTPDIDFTVKQTALGGSIPNVIDPNVVAYKYNVQTKQLDQVGNDFVNLFVPSNS
jgi:hypothetical protein